MLNTFLQDRKVAISLHISRYMVCSECLGFPVPRSLSVTLRAPFSFAPLVNRGSLHSHSLAGSIPLRRYVLLIWGRVLPASDGLSSYLGCPVTCLRSTALVPRLRPPVPCPCRRPLSPPGRLLRRFPRSIRYALRGTLV